jgi:hypothetical protein
MRQGSLTEALLQISSRPNLSTTNDTIMFARETIKKFLLRRNEGLYHLLRHYRETIASIPFRVNAKWYYAVKYYRCRGRFPNFAKPSNLSEYLLAEQLKPDFKRFAPFADKIKVREYIERKGLVDILPKVYQVVKDARQLDFDAFPDKFVLKTNHGCGSHIFCKDKKQLNKAAAVSRLNRTVRSVFTIREPHYQYIEPVIYAEEFIEDGYSESLPVDYKFMVSGGRDNTGKKGSEADSHCVISCILVCDDRARDLKLSCYDTKWNDISHIWLNAHYPSSHVEMPKNLEKMMDITQKIGEDFEFVRVDFYDTGDAVYLSELTFTPACGYLPYFTDFALKELYKPIVVSHM